MRTLFELACAAFDARRYDLCAQHIAEGLLESPNEPRLLSLLTEVCLVEKQYIRARELAGSVIELLPDAPDGYAQLARDTLMDVDYKPPESVTTISHSVKDHQKARFDTARELIMTSLGITPWNPSYHTILAEIELLEDRPAKALESADTALSLDPTSVDAALRRLRALKELRRVDEAIETGLRQLSRDPEHALLHHHLASLYLEKRDCSKSLLHSKQSLRIDPNNEDCREVYWDAVKARNPLFRPFVYWQFVVKRLQNLPKPFRNFGQLGLPVTIGVAFGIWGDRAPQGPALALFITCFFLGMLLIYERPCIFVVDLILYFIDKQYRRTVSRSLLFIHAGATYALLSGIVCLGFAAFDQLAPLGYWLLSLCFLIPGLCLVHTNSWAIRVVFLGNLVLMFLLARHGVSLFQDSQPNSLERATSINVLLGFFFSSIAGAAIYGHFVLQEKEQA